MKIIDKYIIKEHIVPFFGGLSVIIFVILLSHFLKILSRIIEKKVPVFFVLRLIGLNMAWVLSLAIPMACLIATLIAFGRLSQDLEIVALKSVGYPVYRMLLPALLFGLFWTATMGYFNNAVLPETNFKASELARNIRRKKPLAVIQERVFIDDIPGISLWVEDVDYVNDDLYNITIYQRGERHDKQMNVITAPVGHMAYDSTYDAVIFTLENGEIHTYDHADPDRYTRGEFKKQTIRIADLGTQIEERDKKSRSDRELTASMMDKEMVENNLRIMTSKQRMSELVKDRIDRVLSPEARSSHYRGRVTAERQAYFAEKRLKSRLQQEAYLQKSLEKKNNRYRVEKHKKWSLAFACMLFIFAGVPVGVVGRRGGLGTAIGFGMFIFFVYWIFLIGGEELADRGFIGPAVGMWSSNGMLFLIGSYLLYRVVHDSTPGFLFFNKLVYRQKKK
ncbi:MAG: LptF/LptG family permease [Candidatus Zixiibacteriota bacterium]